jgi:hypothetical protein
MYLISEKLAPVLLRGGLEALHADLRRCRVEAFSRRFVGAQILQDIVNRIFKTCACLVGSFHALGHKLAHFKTVHSLRKCAVNFIGTHVELRQTWCEWIDAWVAELVRSDESAGVEQAGFFQDACQFQLYA